MFLIELLNGIFLGVAGNTAYDVAKRTVLTVWQRMRRKSLEDLYLDAFDAAAKELQIIVGPHHTVHTPGIDRNYLQNQLGQNIALPQSNYLNLQDEQLLQLLTFHLSSLPIIYFDDSAFPDSDVSKLTVTFIAKLKTLFRDAVIGNELEFRRALLATVENNADVIQQVQTILQTWADHQVNLLEEIREEITRTRGEVRQSFGFSQQILNNTDSLLESVSRVDQQTEQVGAQLRAIQNALPTKDDKEILLQMQPDPLPEIPSIFSPRTKLVTELCSYLQKTTWLAIIDSAGRGKTYLARAIVDNCDFTFWWISLLYKSPDEARKHLHRHFARALAAIQDKPDLWLQYESDRYTIIDLATIIAQHNQERFVFVIDNLPDPIDSPALFSDLSRISKIFAQKTLKLLTTGQKELPASILTNLNPAPLISNVSPLSDEDVLIMLDRVGAPDNVKNAQTLQQIIIATSKGHPALINSKLRYWSNKNWDLNDEMLMSMLASESVVDVQEEQRSMLRLLTDSPRRFINRLSLLLSDFDRQLALNIAACDPHIEYTGDYLLELQGTWLEKLGTDLFRVTPLLDKVGKDNLSSDEQRRVYLAAANYFLEKGVVDVLRDAINLVSYLFQAQSYDRFTTFVASLIVAPDSQKYIKYIEWTASLISPGQPWPDTMSLDNRIMLRAAQVRIQVKLNKDVKTLDDDLESMLSVADESNANAIVFACGNAGLFLVENPSNLSPIRVFDRAVRMFDLVYRGVAQFDAEVTSPLVDRIDNVIWLTTSLLDGLDHVRYFLQTIEGMPQETQDYIFESDLAPMSTAFLIDSIWKAEADKRDDSQSWEALLSYIDDFLANATLPRIPMIRAALTRAKGVMLADYLHRKEEALLVLNNYDQTADTESLALIILTKLFILFDMQQFAEAIATAQHLRTLRGSVTETYQVSITRTLAISLSALSHWNEARTECEDAIRIAVNPSFNYARLELLGELAWIDWNLSNWQGVFESFHELVQTLLNLDDVESAKFREVFNKTGHALGWYTMMANFGKPPSITQSGEEYAPVFAGLFGRPNSRLGEYTPPVGFSKSLLLTQLSLLAEGTGNPDRAWALYKQALDVDAFELRPNIIGLDAVRIAPLAAQFGEPEEAILIAIQSVKLVVQHKNVTPANEELGLIYTIFCPFFTKLISDGENQSVQIAALAKWRNAINLNSDNLEYSSLWIEVLNAFELLLVDRLADFEQLLPTYHEMVQPALKSLSALSYKPDADLQEKYARQLSAAYHFLTAADKRLGHALYGLGRYVHHFWSQAVERHSVILSNPQLLRRELNTISPNCSGQTVTKVLIAAQYSLKTRLPENVAAILQKYDGNRCV